MSEQLGGYSLYEVRHPLGIHPSPDRTSTKRGGGGEGEGCPDVFVISEGCPFESLQLFCFWGVWGSFFYLCVFSVFFFFLLFLYF